MSFNNRSKVGNRFEQDFKQWIHKTPGWLVEPYGQGLMTEQSRQMMRNSSFNGNALVLEELIADLAPNERNVYMQRIDTIPNLTRWMPDFVVAYRQTIICAPDVKGSISDTPNWSIEMSSILGNKLHSMTGVQCVYVFPPSRYVQYWSCATPDILRDRACKILDGKSVRGGSGTPFYLVPKRSIDIPFKQIMTEIELNGKFEIKTQQRSVILWC